jgi:uncharacterized protein
MVIYHKFSKLKMATYEDAKAISDFLRTKLGDKIEISDFGATIVPKGKKLSNGCYACKSGSWICIYIGVSCNLKCLSCPQKSRHNGTEFIFASLGSDIKNLEDLKKVIEKNKRITGISFSGGEPFLYLKLIYEWLDFINDNFSDLNIYKWIYTNGIKVTKQNCIKLKEKGINEIRFDLAATDYSEKIINKIEYCKKIFDKISVEIPIESWKVNKIIEVLPKLDEIGVDYLNLHELIITCDNKQELIDAGYVDPKLIYESTTSQLFYLPSIIEISRIIEYIENNNLNIIYNDCSARNYVLQFLGWKYQKNRQNSNYVWEDWEDFLVRARTDGNTP